MGFSITSPRANSVHLLENSAGDMTIVVSGRARDETESSQKVVTERNYESPVTVYFNDVAYGTHATINREAGGFTWQLTASIRPAPGPLAIRATAGLITTTTYLNSNLPDKISHSQANAYVSVQLEPDVTPPTVVDIDAPADVSMPDGGTWIPVKVTASDNVRVSGVSCWVCPINDPAWPPQPSDKVPLSLGGNGLWEGSVSVKPIGTGPRPLVVEAWDASGGFSTGYATVNFFDGSPPRLTVLRPQPNEKGQWTGEQTQIVVDIDLADLQTGVTSVLYQLIDSRTGTVVSEATDEFAPPLLGTSNRLNRMLQVEAPGWYRLYVEAKDAATPTPNKTVATVSGIEFGKVFVPSDINSLLSYRAYLRELVDFFCVNFRSPMAAAHWWLDEGSGSEAQDDSGNGFEGVIEGGAGWKIEQVGGQQVVSLELDGVDDCVTTPLDVAPASMRETTWTAWVMPTRLNHSSRQTIFSCDDGGYDRSVIIEANTGSFAVYRGTSADIVAQATLNQWVHIAVVYSPAETCFYTDGLLTTRLPPGEGQDTQNKLCIGKNASGIEFYQGRIRDVRIYDQALSPAQIRAVARGLDNRLVADDLRRVLLQDFSRIANDLNADEMAQRHVTQNRIVGEVLRKALARQGDQIWLSDAVPRGAQALQDGGDVWDWQVNTDSSYPGAWVHRSSPVADQMHQHYFLDAEERLTVSSGDRLFAYVYLDPANAPVQLMLQWHTADSGWSHRAYWGENRIDWGSDGTESRLRMGPLPATGRWIRLEVPATLVGLAGKPVDGWAFTLHGGAADWGYAGKTGQGPQLVGHWSLDETEGDAAADSSGLGNNGALLGGASWDIGSSGRRAVRLDGSDGQVQVGESAQLAFSAAMTMAAWVLPTGTGSGADEGGVIVSREGEYGMARFADGKFKWAFVSAGANWSWVDTDILLPLNRWTHVALTYRNGVVKGYADGVLAFTAQAGGPIGDATTAMNEFRVGGRQALSQCFQGLISDARIYDDALSDADIGAVYRGERADGGYLGAAYASLLRQIGTSYEELRLARGATVEVRKALADRLGMGRSPDWSQHLESLMLAPDQITEWTLERLFGLLASTHDPFAPASVSNLQKWQLADLRARWREEDHGRELPIIDPDLVLAADVLAGPAHALWQQRSDALESLFAELQQLRKNAASPLDGLGALLDNAYPPEFLTGLQLPFCESEAAQALALIRCLETQRKSGRDISEVLEDLYLSPAAFAYLVRLLSLAEAVDGIVTDAEWEQVCHILVSVWKSRQRTSWIQAEEDAGLALSPDYFMLTSDQLPTLPSTGIDQNGALVTRGQVDAGWSIQEPAGATAYVASKQPGSWLPPTDRSQWLSPTADATEDNSALSNCTYVAHFDLKDSDPLSVQITLRVAVDDVLTDVRLNGVSTGLTTAGFGKFTTLALGNGFKSGENEIALDVANSGGGPTGLRVELSFAGDPLPLAKSIWRTNDLFRLDWQKQLRARIEQEEGLLSAYAENLRVTETETLALLRDHLVAAVALARNATTEEAGQWLSELLHLETDAVAARLTTRVQQAIETLQSFIFSLRTQRLGQDHPAKSWQLAEEEAAFDEEWRWMGSYETWRAAHLVFLYPENVLLPSLRENSEGTAAFRQLLLEIRARSRLTPVMARRAAQNYLDGLGCSVGRMAHWRFGEGQGNDVEDASGNGNTASIHAGVAWGEGPVGGALIFDGAGEVEVSHTPSIEVGKNDADFSVAFWIWLDGGPVDNQWRGVMLKGSQADEVRRTFGLWLHPGSNQIRFRITTNSDSNAGGDSIGILQEKRWYHIVYIKKGRDLDLFIDAQKDATAILGDAVISNTDSLYIGKDPFSWTPRSFEGKLSDIRIYNYALSQGDIAALYDRPNLFLTDERTESALRALRRRTEEYLKPYYDAGEIPPYHLQEVFYFVPMAIAFQLQRSGEFLAALDWYQTVYAYNLPPAERKVYYGLVRENNDAPILTRTEHWILEGLNPHSLAKLRCGTGGGAAARWNPYTRYTLMSLASCFMEYGDSEFARDTGESLAKARLLYANALELLAQPDLDVILPDKPEEASLPNPMLWAMRGHMENQLAKLRLGRNIAGMQREIEIPEPSQSVVRLASGGSFGQLYTSVARRTGKPTPYRFVVLLERCKQLATIAQQIEAGYLAALEKRDAENYNLLKASFDLGLADANRTVQDLRVTEAKESEEIAKAQIVRAQTQQKTYTDWIEQGLNASESMLLAAYSAAGAARRESLNAAMYAEIYQTAIEISNAIVSSNPMNPVAPGASAMAITASGLKGMQLTLKTVADTNAVAADTTASISSFMATHERRVDEWRLGRDLAANDEAIGNAQKSAAEAHTKVAEREKQVAEMQYTQAKSMASFLANKFTSAELYDWMAGVLGGVYGYFLQQATAVASMAESQLAFERQEAPTSLIQADYWEVPDDAAGNLSTETTSKDRRGLTGSARLLQDIYQVDQYAFETNKRKLNLAQTFSLAVLDGYAFEHFRQTGVLDFVTRLPHFDEGFPGHYLRLIKRVKVSVVALVPPTRGIRASLTASGVSRVVVDTGGVFQEVAIRRQPESIALSSPVGATGVFELDSQSELLAPFESMGVATAWRFEMPRAANPLDFDAIADVLISIEYTALYNEDFRRQVIKTLDPQVEASRVYSIRDDYPDIWYALNNPQTDSQEPPDIRFSTLRTHFPPNLDGDITVKDVLAAVIPTDPSVALDGAISGSFRKQQPVDAPVTILAQVPLLENRVRTNDGGGATAWAGVKGQPILGDWRFILSESLLADLADGRIHDVLISLTFSARRPTWP